MVSNSRTIPILVGSLLIIVFIFYTIGNALPAWKIAVENVFMGTIEKAGLWKACSSKPLAVCVPYSCSTDGYNSGGCKAKIAGILLTTASIMLVILAMYFFIHAYQREDNNVIFLNMMKIFLLISLLMSAVAIIMPLVVIEVNNSTGLFRVRLGVSAYLCLIAIVIHLITAILGVFIQ